MRLMADLTPDERWDGLKIEMDVVWEAKERQLRAEFMPSGPETKRLALDTAERDLKAALEGLAKFATDWRYAI